MQELLNDLKTLKLSGMVCSIKERLMYAQNNKLGYQEFLALLCEDEHSSRRDNNYKRRKKAAKLPANKNIEEFDFTFQPSIDEKLINDLAVCNYTNHYKKVIIR